jgi:hypothetical protein
MEDEFCCNPQQRGKEAPGAFLQYPKHTSLRRGWDAAASR